MLEHELSAIVDTRYPVSLIDLQLVPDLVPQQSDGTSAVLWPPTMPSCSRPACYHLLSSPTAIIQCGMGGKAICATFRRDFNSFAYHYSQVRLVCPR